MQASFSTPILKYSKYKLDGSGRDSYIFSNNGGLYQNDSISHLVMRNFIVSTDLHLPFVLSRLLT